MPETQTIGQRVKTRACFPAKLAILPAELAGSILLAR
jgi:hypothetical protein